MKRARINPDVSAHTLRNSVATYPRERGANLAKVAYILGHEDMRTAEPIYFDLGANFSAGVTDITDIAPDEDNCPLHELREQGRVVKETKDNFQDVSSRRGRKRGTVD